MGLWDQFKSSFNNNLTKEDPPLVPESPISITPLTDSQVNEIYNSALNYYRVSNGEYKQDLQKAISLFEKAAAGNHPEAIVYLGEMYLSGMGCKKDSSKGLEYLHRAENLRVDRALKLLAVEYSVSNIDKALKYYEKYFESDDFKKHSEYETDGYKDDGLIDYYELLVSSNKPTSNNIINKFKSTIIERYRSSYDYYSEHELDDDDRYYKDEKMRISKMIKVLDPSYNFSTTINKCAQKSIYSSSLPDEELFADTNYKRALQDIKESRFSSAINNLKAVLDYKKDSYEVYYKLGFCCLANGKAEESIGFIKTSINLKQDYLDSYRLLGKVYKYLNRYEEAFLYSTKTISEIHKAGRDYIKNLNNESTKYPDGYWEFVANEFMVGAIVTGSVSFIAEHGVFVELAPGVEGLLHCSEFPPGAPQNPNKFARVDDCLTVEITIIDFEQKRILLSMRNYNYTCDTDFVSDCTPDDDFLDSLTLTKATNVWDNFYDLAETYYYGLGDEIEDHREALKYYKKAAELGSDEAMLMLGVMHREGEGCIQNNDKALDYLKAGVKSGNANCYAEMAKLFSSIDNIENASKCWDKFFTSPSNKKNILLHAFSYLIFVKFSEVEYTHKGIVMQFESEIAERIERFKANSIQRGEHSLVDSLNEYYEYLS